MENAINNLYGLEDILAGLDFTKNDDLLSYIGHDDRKKLVLIHYGTHDEVEQRLQFILYLKEHLPITDIFHKYVDIEKGYFIIDYSEQTIDISIPKESRHQGWGFLSKNVKLYIISTLINVANIIKTAYKICTVDNFFTPDSFLIRDGKMYLRNIRMLHPGTENQSNSSPSIRMLGWMIIHFISGYYPVKFDLSNKDLMKSNLSYFIPDYAIIDLVLKCLSEEEQPDWDTISLALDTFFRKTRNSTSENTVSFFRGTEGVKDNSWINLDLMSIIPDNDSWSNGKAGYYYCMNMLISTIKHVEHTFTSINSPSVESGLFRGTAGFFLGDTETAEWHMKEYFPAPIAFNIEEGAAGQGLAALLKLKTLNPKVTFSNSVRYADYLLEYQTEDGSWRFNSRKGIFGFTHGVAGVASFLWLFYLHFPEERIKEAAIRTMDYLIMHSHDNNGSINWPVRIDKNVVTPWFDDGATGIALAFIVAYKATMNDLYKKMAEDVLSGIPADYHSNHLCYLNGLAGIGDTYLEAFYTFKNPIWKSRASFIFNQLSHLRCRNESGYYWVVENEQKLRSGLLDGNLGIFYFLYRFVSDGRIPHLFMPE